MFRTCLRSLLLLVVAMPVAAEPVQLTRGQFIHDDEFTIMLIETATFRVSGIFSHDAFEVMPHEQCWRAGDCVPGTTFDAGFQTVVTPLNYPWHLSTFNGNVYPELVIDGDLTATGSGIVPGPLASGTTRLDYPVTLTGLVTIFSDPSRTTQLASAELFGSGTVSINWIRGFSDPDNVRARLENYQFAAAADPVPEPGTMLLVGSGALALLRRRHRSARRQRT